MPADRRRVTYRLFPVLASVALLAGACQATAATAIPTSAPATASATPSGPTGYATTTFSVPFSVVLPAGWKVGDEKQDMFTAYLATAAGGPQVGIDIQLVPVVHTDPCNLQSATVDGGSSAADLVTWMLAFKPLAGKAGAPATIDGSAALVVDEQFAGTPCENAELWPTAGGWLDAGEQKRYFVFEMGGKRLVATIFSSDANFAANVDAARAVLGALDFKG